MSSQATVGATAQEGFVDWRVVGIEGSIRYVTRFPGHSPSVLATAPASTWPTYPELRNNIASPEHRNNIANTSLTGDLRY
jgi:hypothetical protein